jgi:cytochrome c biogenesis protein CcmG/thiol:disulfide interchange protein DsbE
MTRSAVHRSTVRWWALVIAGITLVATVAFVAFRGDEGAAGYSTDPAAWDLPRINGTGHIRLTDFAGRPLVVNFFASWCVACDAELPGFAAASAALRGQVAFVGVNALETGDRFFMPRRHGITWWPLARDVGGSNGDGLHRALSGGLDAMPITAWYDSHGRLLHVDRGALPGSALRARLHELYAIDVPASGAAG